MTRFRGVLVCFCLIATATFSLAQGQAATGLPGFASFQDGGADTINLGNLNVHFNFPIFSRGGRVRPLNFSLGYDSSINTIAQTDGVLYFVPVSTFGWESPSISLSGNAPYTSTQQKCNYNNTWYYYLQYTYSKYVDRNGTTHYFSPALNTTSIGSTPCTPVIPPGSSPATDGSGYIMSVTNNQVTMHSASGDVIIPLTSVTDSNGNVITISSAMGNVIDTLGTAVTGNMNGYNQLITGAGAQPYTYTGPAGESETANLNVAMFAVRTNYQCSTYNDYANSSLGLVTSLVLADGSQYSFAYEATPGYPGWVTGRLASITLPSGGTISYQYSGGTNGINCLDGSPAVLTRTTPDGVWVYNHTVSGSGITPTGSSTTVTDPQGNQTVISFAYDGNTSNNASNFYETQRLVYQGSSTSGTLLVTRFNCYNGNSTNCPTASVSSPITQKDAYVQPPGVSAAYSETIYNSNGLPKDHKDYDYGAVLVREVATTYNSTLGNNILDRPSQVTVKNGSGTVLSQTNYTYDEGTPTATTGTPQLVAVSGSRGNATTVSSLVSGSTYLTKHYSYFDTGLVQSATDINGNQTTYTYGACGNSFATNISSGGLSSSKTWDCNGGVITSVTDANNKTTAYSYKTASGTPDPLWRLLQATDPLSNTTAYTHTAASGGNSASSEATLTFNNGTSTSDVLTTFDSLGRAWLTQKRQAPGSSTFDTVSRTYDSNGRLASVSMACAAAKGVACSTPTTTYSYDALDRTANVTNGGGGYANYTYSSNDVLQVRGPAPSGENTKRKQLQYDGLGRLSSVCELTSASGSGNCAQTAGQTGYWTKYTYDGRGKLTGVTQNAQGTSQTRSYSYDGLGRLTSETNPESGTKTYIYDYTPISSCNTVSQTFNGDLVRTVDANGTNTCFYYDSLHRLTDVGTNRPSIDGCKRFRYDNSSGVLGAQPSGVHTYNSLGRLAEAETDTCVSPITSSSILTDEWANYSARGEVTDVWEKTPNSSGYYHPTQSYWANGQIASLWISGLSTISYGVDGEGRPSTVSASSGQNPVTATNYNPSSQVTGVTFGSGDSDAFTFDANTGRMTQYKYTVNGSSDIGNLTWNANGNLKTLGITDPFNSGDTQTCNYAHDDLSRISSANCGSVWSQTFTYDPFGNISKSGSISFLPGYNTATNRFTLAGTSYDADGNLLNDTFHTYSWNADERPLTIDSIGLTYDAMGRMVEQNKSGTFYQIVYTPTGGKFGMFTGQTIQQLYVPLPGGAKAEYLSSGLSGYRHADWLGSDRLESSTTRSILDDNAYAPFGEPYAQTGNGEISFTGQNEDTIWPQYDFLFRQYPSKQGRWNSPDPAGAAASDLANPQTWNRYAYAGNNPLTHIDPLGLKVEGCPSGDGCDDQDPPVVTIKVTVNTPYEREPQVTLPTSWWGRISSDVRTWVQWIKAYRQNREPNPNVTNVNDAVGLLALGSEKAGRVVGPVGALVSVANDPSDTNLVITGVGVIPGPDVPVAIGSVAWDLSNDAADIMNRVFTPDANQSETMPDGNGHTIENPAVMFDMNACWELGCN